MSELFKSLYKHYRLNPQPKYSINEVMQYITLLSNTISTPSQFSNELFKILNETTTPLPTFIAGFSDFVKYFNHPDVQPNSYLLTIEQLQLKWDRLFDLRKFFYTVLLEDGTSPKEVENSFVEFLEHTPSDPTCVSNSPTVSPIINDEDAWVHDRGVVLKKIAIHIGKGVKWLSKKVPVYAPSSNILQSIEPQSSCNPGDPQNSVPTPTMLSSTPTTVNPIHIFFAKYIRTAKVLNNTPDSTAILQELDWLYKWSNRARSSSSLGVMNGNNSIPNLPVVPPNIDPKIETELKQWIEMWGNDNDDALLRLAQLPSFYYNILEVLIREEESKYGSDGVDLLKRSMSFRQSVFGNCVLIFTWVYKRQSMVDTILSRLQISKEVLAKSLPFIGMSQKLGMPQSLRLMMFELQKQLTVLGLTIRLYTSIRLELREVMAANKDRIDANNTIQEKIQQASEGAMDIEGEPLQNQPASPHMSIFSCRPLDNGHWAFLRRSIEHVNFRFFQFDQIFGTCYRWFFRKVFDFLFDTFTHPESPNNVHLERLQNATIDQILMCCIYSGHIIYKVKQPSFLAILKLYKEAPMILKQYNIEQAERLTGGNNRETAKCSIIQLYNTSFVPMLKDSPELLEVSAPDLRFEEQEELAFQVRKEFIDSLIHRVPYDL